ncbi:hypothetical protein WUBG_06172, partial [Wuchereria bancrofti]
IRKHLLANNVGIIRTQNNYSPVLQKEIQEIPINSLSARLNSTEQQALDDVK